MKNGLLLLLLVLNFTLLACEYEETQGIPSEGEEQTEQGGDENVGADDPVDDDLPPDVGDDDEPAELSTGRITYVGKRSNVTDFRGYGQHLFYFPAFDLPAPDDFHRTDEDAAYYNDAFDDFKHHKMLSLETRTFSPDAGGSPLGVKSRGGHAGWPVFVLPDGSVGLSGALYDDATRQNSNNTFNQINLNEDSPSNFCLNIILDNNNLRNIPDEKFMVRSDQKKEDLDLAGHPDLTFDGQPDIYTFRYENMTSDGKIKIKMRTTKPKGSSGERVTGAGIAGIMISDYSTCAPAMAVSNY